MKPATTATKLEGLGTRLCFIHDFVHGRLLLDVTSYQHRRAHCARNYCYSRTEQPSAMQIRSSNSMDFDWTLPKRRVRHQLCMSEIFTSFLTQTLDWTTGLTSLPVSWATHPEKNSQAKRRYAAQSNTMAAELLASKARHCNYLSYIVIVIISRTYL